MHFWRGEFFFFFSWQIAFRLFKELEKQVDLYLIQEHWLFDCQLDLLNEIHNDYIGIGKAVDSNDPILI
jgi:hypothetical protein